ncbi:MAG: ATP-binding protein [Promicromonosporaceae bacterium]|nr:ATP-binding protein [Promicromonosporaceae bacterium]
MEFPAKPAELFARDREWAALCRFATDQAPGATLGVVTGRRRQGKTYLLRALTQALGGFYFAATEASDSETLRRLGVELGRFLQTPAAMTLRDWHEAFDALLALGRERAIPLVIDEFPYLLAANPAISSILQDALTPLREERETSQSRLLLCGSALSVMGRLLVGSAPLRGRASLELVVHPLDYRLAAGFWNQDDPHTALKVHAVVGGTPAYRREFVRDDVPTDPADFDNWVCRTVLSPSSPLFREARYLLAEEPGLRDASTYHSVLAAVASGNSTRGRIASFVGRKSGDLAHPLTVLEDAGLLRRDPDAFRANRSEFHIAEPLLAFHHAVMRPIWADLEAARDPRDLWTSSQQTFSANVLGPHFERVARQWLRFFAPATTLRRQPTSVLSGTVNDALARTSHKIDIAAFAAADDGGKTLLAIGEVKWGEVVGRPHLDRLQKVKGLLTAAEHRGASDCQLMLVSAAGFSETLIERAANSDELVLVNTTDLYTQLG